MELAQNQSEQIYTKIKILLDGPIWENIEDFATKAMALGQDAAYFAKEDGKYYTDKKFEVGSLGGSLGGLTKRFKAQVKTPILELFIQELHNLNLLRPSETTAHTAKNIMINNKNIFYGSNLSTQTLYDHFGRKDKQGKVGNSGEFALCEEHQEEIKQILDKMLKDTRSAIKSAFENAYKKGKN